MRQCLSFEIVDRWGIEIFKSNDTTNCWDGKNKNNNTPAADGVYYYIAKFQETNYVKGFVPLIR